MSDEGFFPPRATHSLSEVKPSIEEYWEEFHQKCPTNIDEDETLFEANWRRIRFFQLELLGCFSSCDWILSNEGRAMNSMLLKVVQISHRNLFSCISLTIWENCRGERVEPSRSRDFNSSFSSCLRRGRQQFSHRWSEVVGLRGISNGGKQSCVGCTRNWSETNDIDNGHHSFDWLLLQKQFLGETTRITTEGEKHIPFKRKHFPLLFPPTIPMKEMAIRKRIVVSDLLIKWSLFCWSFNTDFTITPSSIVIDRTVKGQQISIFLLSLWLKTVVTRLFLVLHIERAWTIPIPISSVDLTDE